MLDKWGLVDEEQLRLFAINGLTVGEVADRIVVHPETIMRSCFTYGIKLSDGEPARRSDRSLA